MKKPKCLETMGELKVFLVAINFLLKLNFSWFCSKACAWTFEGGSHEHLPKHGVL
jgi:hypothetical protein